VFNSDRNTQRRTEEPNIRVYDLYLADGFTGEIRRLISDTESMVFRASKDGRFVAFRNRHHADDFVIIYLFDVKNEAIVGEFKWRPVGTVDGWELFRFDNFFRVVGIWQSGAIVAVVELDLSTMELRTVFR